MITLEERVRAAAEATAREITPDSIPDWPDFAIRAASGRERRALTARWRTRVLAPLAAAAAVAAVIALAVGISGRTQARRTSVAPAAAAGSLSCTRPDSQCIPRYYLDIKGIIRDRTTGATVATVRLPRPYRTIDAIAGSADDRTFVLAAQTDKSDGNYPVRLFLARFNPAARSVTLSALPIPIIPGASLLTGLALSPDGRKLATAVQADPRRVDAVVTVYSLASPSSAPVVKVWQSAGTIGASPYDAGAISWSSTGMLAVNWETGKVATSGVLLLNTAAPSGSLLARSRFLLHTETSNGKDLAFAWDGMLTPDGTRIVAVLERMLGSSKPGHPVYESEVAEFSAITGKLVRYLYRVTGRNASETLEWTNTSGSALVVGAPPNRSKPQVFGVLSGNHFRPIPGAPAPNAEIATLAF
jgi:hypothetical protein